MQTTAASWEMTHLAPTPLYVSLVSAANSLPIFLLGYFAGVFADRFDRRTYMIVWQVWMMLAAAALSVLAFTGGLTHWNLLALVACIGIGNAMNGPAWHAMLPEIVSRQNLPQAIGLNSAGFNAARTVGPVIGQMLQALVGTFLLFAINAVTFLGVIVALLRFRRSAEAKAEQRKVGFWEGVIGGLAYARSSGELRAVFARGLLFFLPASALITLLPVVAKYRLDADAVTFGVLFAAFGVGAVLSASMLPYLNRRYGADFVNVGAMLVFAAASTITALTIDAVMVGVGQFLAGACWIAVIANNGVAVQSMLPNWVRARGIAMNQMMFFGSITLGSVVWGKIATLFGVQSALLVSGVALIPLAWLATRIRLPHPGARRPPT